MKHLSWLKSVNFKAWKMQNYALYSECVLKPDIYNNFSISLLLEPVHILSTFHQKLKLILEGTYLGYTILKTGIMKTGSINPKQNFF